MEEKLFTLVSFYISYTYRQTYGTSFQLHLLCFTLKSVLQYTMFIQTARSLKLKYRFIQNQLHPCSTNTGLPPNCLNNSVVSIILLVI